jgi:hypothetical protein
MLVLGRKLAIAGITTALLFTSNQAISATPPKFGSPCSKLGKISIHQGRKFTCIKNGKKLMWNKGVVIKSAAPKATSTTQPVPTSSPSANPSPSPSMVATPAQSIAPSPTASPTPKAPTSFDDLIENYSGIAYAAWSKSRAKILASQEEKINFTLLLGPTSQLTYKEPLIPIGLITRLYSGYIVSKDLTFMAFNYQDRDWATKRMDELVPNTDSRWIKYTACATEDRCWGGGSFYDGKGKYLAVITVGYISSNHTSGTLEAHEYAHVVQQMNYGLARPPVEFVTNPWPPDWYWEGQAQFAQHAAVYFDSFEGYMRERRAASSQMFEQSKYRTEYIQNFFVFNAPDDWRKNYEKWRIYDLGAMFVEILTALKGPESTMEIWKSAKGGVTFDVAFERVYGISFAKALPIMSRAIALQLGHEK